MTETSSPALPHYAAGAEAFKKNDLEVAARNFRKAAEADPKFFRAFAYLGMVYDKLGRIDDAIEAYRECIDLAADYHKAYNNVGELYRRKGLLDYASMVFKMATELQPENAMYFYNLGLTYSDIGMLSQAEKALARCVELDPANFDSANELAQIRFQLLDLNGALKVLEDFTARCPDHERVPELDARLKLLRRRIEEAGGGTPKQEEKPPEPPAEEGPAPEETDAS